ncbi:hypothetical protein PHET_06569 [Paragonimus heterotremus]|uniref:Serpin domain-containing protein n=1 Tax=Paragonimus heterotremus TaxID=100268 RepID=A0A8J4SKW5_9TREM|nr:hypothetical protein PHET_06569 [Paragonimus heterotremus]
MIASLQDFTNELYRTVLDEQGPCLINTYFSPTSVYLGLLATMMGSQGRTKEQIVKAINLDRNIEETKSHDLLSKRMAGLLRPIPRCITGGTTQSVFVIGANRMFYSAGLNISPQYLKDIERYYGFESEFRHFVEYPERDRYGINCWMSQQMAQTVPELMPLGSITPETKFVVINGMYFKGAWAKIFHSNNTKPDCFHLLNGNEITVNMMYQCRIHAVQYLPCAQARALKVQFRDLNWSMLLILPNELHGLPDALTYLRQPGRLAQIIQGEFKSREVHLYLPRFKICQGHGMNEKKKMTTLGIYDAFTPGTADFSPICGNYPLHLDQIRHKATLFIYEDGVTPGAVSVFSGDPVHGVPPPDEFRFDHPFFLAIVAQDQVPVFLGHVVEPEVI